MQMPAYYECLRKGLALGEKNTLTPCYISLPEDTDKTKVDAWEDYPEMHPLALKALREIITQIKGARPGKIKTDAVPAEYPAIPSMANRTLDAYLRTELLGN